MSNTNILQLPVAIGIDGSEYIPLVQGGTTKRAAAGLFAQYSAGSLQQDANTVYAGPASGSAAAPTFRHQVPADLPNVASSFYWDSTHNRLGLGTAAPTVPLNVGTPYAALDGNEKFQVGSATSSYLTVRDGTRTLIAGAYNSLVQVGSFTNSAFALVTNDTERARFDTSGNFGIGKTPSYLLDVNGNINSLAYSNYLAGGTRTVRRVASGNINFYVTKTGNDSTGDGSIGNPWLTINYACSQVYALVDFNSFAVTVNVGAGTYAEQVFASGATLGNVVYNIVGASSSTVTVQAPNGLYAFYAKDLAAIQIQGVTLTGTATASGLVYASQNGIVDVSSDVAFGSCAIGAQISVSQGGFVNVLSSSVALTGNAAQFCNATTNGVINFNGQSITVNSARAYTTFCVCLYGGIINAGGLSFVGAGAAGTTGTRFQLGVLGTVQTSGIDPNSIWLGNVNGYAYVGNGLDLIPNRLFLSASGPVGIRTVAPTAVLTICPTNDNTYTVIDSNEALQLASATAAYMTARDGTRTYLAGVTGSAVTVGAYSNHNLSLITNNTVWATLDTAGKLGIGGNAAPTAPITIGAAPVAVLDSSEKLQLCSASAAYMTAIDGTRRAIFGAYNSLVQMGSYSNSDCIFVTNNTERLRIANNGSFLSFGGQTSSFPALKQSSAIMQVRLGNDGGYAALEASALGAGGASSTTTFVNLAASTTGISALRFVQGVAPSAPVDGDMWREDNTNTGLKIRINGVTKTVTVS